MNRRIFMGLFCSGASLFSVGCNGRFGNNGEIDPQLDLFASVERTESNWRLTVRTRNTLDTDVSIHNITVLAFNDAGEEVCRSNVGDLIKFEDRDRTVTVRCTDFPAIISAKARESPCDGAKIEILYWIGSEAQRGADLPDDVKVWEDTYRNCGESLPPERVLDQVSSSQNGNVGASL